VQHVGFGFAALVLANILEPRWRTVVTIGNNHSVLHNKRPNLPALAVGVLSPNFGHLKVAPIEMWLFFAVWVLFLIHLLKYKNKEFDSAILQEF